MARYSNYTNTVVASAPVTSSPGYHVALYDANGLEVADLGSTSDHDCQVEDLLITEKLTELDEVSCKIPRKLLTSKGEIFYKHSYATIEGILEVIREADGYVYRFRIKDRHDDKEKFVSIKGKSLGVDLAEYFTNESSGGSYFYGRTPTEIMNTVLQGKRHMRVKNPRFGILDADDLPTNWTHPDNWAHDRDTNGYPRWSAPQTANEISWGDYLHCTPLRNYEIQFTTQGATAMAGLQYLSLVFYDVNYTYLTEAAIGRVYVTNESVDTLVYTVSGTASTPASAYYMRPALLALDTNNTCYYSDIRILEKGEDSGWVYEAITASGSGVDERLIDVWANDGKVIHDPGVKWGGTVPHGYWDGTGFDWDAPSASYIRSSTAGSKITGIYVSPYITCKFDGSGVAESEAKISILNPGTNNATTVTSIPVSSNTEYTMYTDPNRETGITVEVVTGTVRFVGFELSSENLLSPKFDENTALDVLATIQEAVGGEAEFDGAASAIKHYPVRGVDWSVSAGCPTFMRGTNLPQLELKEESTDIVNRLLFEGYGGGTEDAPKLLIVVDADERDSSGSASSDYYGVRRGKHTDKSIRNFPQAYQMARQIVNENCWPTQTYETEIYDVAVRDGTIGPGDTIRCIYQDEDVYLRIQEITRDIFKPKRGDVIVGDPGKKPGEVIAKVKKELKGVAAPQGFLIPQTYGPILEDFDTTYSAVLEFDVMYGQDFEHLYLTYELTSLRSSSKGAQQSSSVGGTSEAGGQYSSTTDASSTTTTEQHSGGWLTQQSSIDTAGGGSHTHFIAERVTGAYVPTGSEYTRWRGYNQYFNSIYFQTHGGQAGNIPVGTILTTGTIGTHSHQFSHYHYLDAHYHGMSHTHGFAVQNHTHTFTVPAHTHNLEFGIYQSPTVPTQSTFELGFGNDFTTISEASGTLIRNLDVKKYLKRDSNGLPYEGTHTLRVSAPIGSSSGRVKARLFGVSYIVSKLD